MMTNSNLKFIHIADLHMDAPFRENGNSGYSTVRRRDLRTVLERILKLCREEAAQMLLVSGDLYEHHYTSKKSIVWISQLFESLSIPVVIVPGNHDPYVADSWYKLWSWPQNVIILHAGKPSVFLEDLNAFIYGIGFSAPKQGKPDLSIVDRPKEDCFNILMLHGTLDLEVGEQYYNPVSSGDLADLGYDYHALGHFHNPYQSNTLKTAYNPGSPEPLGFDEPGEHGVLAVEMTSDHLGNKSIQASHITVAERNYRQKDLDISACTSEDELKMKLVLALEGLNPDKDLLRLTLKGRTSLSFDTQDITASLFGQWLFGSIQDETQPCYDYEAMAREPNLKGAFVAEMLRRINDCPENDTDHRRQLQNALDFGLEALENGRLDSLKDC